MCGGVRTDANRGAGGGVEPTVADLQSDRQPPKTLGKPSGSQGVGADTGAVGTKTTHFTPDLQALIDAWGILPDALKAGILAMVRNVGGKADCQKPQPAG